MTQVPTGNHLKTYFSIEIMRTSQRHPNIRKPLCIHPQDHPQVRNKFGIEDDNETKKSPETKT